MFRVSPCRCVPSFSPPGRILSHPSTGHARLCGSPSAQSQQRRLSEELIRGLLCVSGEAALKLETLRHPGKMGLRSP